MLAVLPSGRIVKSVQLTMFGQRTPIMRPGSRGGRFYQTEQGTLRYGEHPLGGYAPSTLYGKLVGRDVFVTDGKHAGTVGRAIAASPSHLHIRTADGQYIKVPLAHVREQLSLTSRKVG